MTRHRFAAGLLGVFVLACTGSNSNLNSSGDSSGGSNSGGSNSGGSNSGASNSGSDNSSQGSSGSSGQSAASSGNTANGLNASADSSANSVQNSVASTSQGLGASSAQSTRASLPILATVAVGATVVGVGYLIWGPATRASMALPPPPIPAAAPAPAAAAQFLRSRERQLRMDLAVGAGPAIEDLAALAEIRPQNLPRFGRLLREHRDELLTWTAARALTPEAAAQVLRRVGELATLDGALVEDGRAFRERHPGT